ncbi:cell wall hydrolase [Anaerocolumna xylanovorans]|uniref:Cell Wall Hydrolase n=1 Tax=Anaerocolumna xylanovorans DSM 12503 TaxID=1121345 RepID=A0A1M7YM24_9FIRM|nr:cell wall hydrolase [Anaerocolumna xylanovorans]SHO53671.1 Cell Wall Hydrolase [Anaerocolumna xylanovorans DSM 12503]
MRRKSLLSGCVLLTATTLLIGSKWEVNNQKVSVQTGSRRLIQGEIYRLESVISAPTPIEVKGNSNKSDKNNITSESGRVDEIKLASFISDDFDIDEYVYDITAKERKILERITEAECTNQSLEAKMNIVSVVLNRVGSDVFPDNIKSVVFQKNQFSPIRDKRYYSVNIAKSTKEAVDKVLKNGVINKALYFCNPADVKSERNKSWFKKLIFLFQDDSGHCFYK